MDYIAPTSLFSCMTSQHLSPDSVTVSLDKPVATAASAEALLDGLNRLLQFLFEAEADYLCGAPLHMRSHKRVNYRIGYHRRKFRTHLGTIPIRIPHLLNFCHRVPIVKRANRLSAGILESLARIHATGVTSETAAALIKELWTVELPDELLASLVARLVPALNTWCNGDGSNKSQPDCVSKV